MNTLSVVVTTALLQSLWQDAAVAVVAASLLWALRERGRAGSRSDRSTGARRANARYLVACGALALMTLLPIATGVTMATGAVAHAGPAEAGSHDSSAAAGRDVAAFRLGELPFDLVGDHMPMRAWIAGAQAWALPLWLLGVLIGSLRLVASGLHSTSLRRQAADADDALQAVVSRMAIAMRLARGVTVALTPAIDGAATLGWLRPVILFAPATALGLTPRQLEAVVAHELAHIRRHDYVVNLLQLVAETVFFYHPAVWWASHRMRVERELCCDDAAVEACGDAQAYARALAMMASMPQPALAAAGGPLRMRIERLLGVTASRRRRGVPRAGATASALVALIAIAGAAWVHAQAPAPASGLATGTAVLSGMVLDPLGNPVANTPITLVGRGVDVVQPSATDAEGRYRFDHLPAGQYSVRTPITDSILPMSVNVAAGEQRSVMIDLGVDDVAVNLRVCADCRTAGASAVPAASSAPGIPDRPAIVGAEPAEGWDAFNARSFPYPAALTPIGMQGTVLVEARVTSSGAVAGAHATGMNMVLDTQHGRAARATCPNGDCATQFATAAVRLVQEQRWRPATVHGTPVDVPLHVTVEYTLVRGN